MNVSAQPITGHLLRAHPPGMGYGDPYTWACMAVPDPQHPGTAVLTGSVELPGEGQREALAEALRALGYTHVRWERRVRGRARWTRRFEL
ncbi:hypothetical protein LRF89_06570 [Halorhodospira sp. 9621]|uniref:hypothetical protein n=1 Tax=Halorhodospira sp. 9621 TaxID=2899135 RepID=UPI001EE7D6FB|nr:hypothetical protein [Halorhodospira sp. 9621]MCG5533104.1 hypothetical protein [Halorhodospira sp. 9621]